MGPGVLNQILSGLEHIPDPRVLVGFEGKDDAAVYQVRPDLLLIQTMDFFPPLVDDPYDYGRIAAANAISDIYAMGGKPIMALNILTFPSCLDLQIVEQILAGGNRAVMEAGMNILGGHSIEDTEPKYGLSVLGICHPDDLLTNAGAKPGDRLVLTKKIGTGVMTTAGKAGLLGRDQEREIVESMAKLNRHGLELAGNYRLHAATDITGFGLIGHALELAEASGVSIELYADKIPCFDQAREFAQMGMIPGGAYKNRDFVGAKFRRAESVPLALEDLAFDPQTSGGLLLAIDPQDLDQCLADFKQAGQVGVEIGRVYDYNEGVRINLL